MSGTAAQRQAAEARSVRALRAELSEQELVELRVLAARRNTTIQVLLGEAIRALLGTVAPDEVPRRSA